MSASSGLIGEGPNSRAKEDTIKAFLASLEEKIKDQIAMEYHDPAHQEYRYNNLTVPELLAMLSYMFSD